MNKKLITLIVVIIILAIAIENQTSKVTPQLIAPVCFEQEDCRVAPDWGYCDVKFDCIQGQCIEEQILCPETCNSGADEDLDGEIDCDDSDCWDSPSCSCTNEGFDTCAVGRCYCPIGTSAQWQVTEASNFCACV